MTRWTALGLVLRVASRLGSITPSIGVCTSSALGSLGMLRRVLQKAIFKCADGKFICIVMVHDWWGKLVVNVLGA